MNEVLAWSINQSASCSVLFSVLLRAPNGKLPFNTRSAIHTSLDYEIVSDSEQTSFSATRTLGSYNLLLLEGELGGECHVSFMGK